ncbi:MAG: TonB-dependent receptor plug domain-containing protein [Bacteroidales bacterium]|nr:TonB-dependent receptor plug domain-containing protein [Bacteroidales bacterium]
MRNFTLLHTPVALPYAIAMMILCPQAVAQEAVDTTLTIKESVISARVRPRSDGTGSMLITAGMVKEIPALLGDPDLVKTLQLFPGIQAATEGLSGMIVRGGGADENLILLDGVEVYTQGHILGLFSPFQSEAIGEVIIHKGAFPARFGGRASSILEIQSTDPFSSTNFGRNFSGCLGIGPLSDKLHLQGLNSKRNISYSVSGRGMHTLLMDGALRAFKVTGNFHFHDLHAKVENKIDDRNLLSVSYFSSKDNLYYKEEGSKTDVSWGSSMASASWRKNWNGGLSSDIILAFSGYSTGMGYKTTGTKRESLRTGLDDLLAKADFRFDGKKGRDIRFGAETIRHKFTPEADMLDGHTDRTIIKGLETSLYLEDGFTASSWLIINSGLRLSFFSTGGTARLTPEPRISVTAIPSNKVRTTLSFSRVSQYLHQLSSPVAALPVDLIVPVTGRVRPVVSDQLSLGVGYHVTQGLEISLEAYYKSSSNILEYKDGVMFIDDFEAWEDEVASGLGRSMGMEFLVRKTTGKTKGWIGYTLSKSERRFQDGTISGGNWFPSRHDSRHNLSVVLNETIGNGWDVGAVWTYSSGGAVTIPLEDGSMPQRGNHRLPPSHRLDLSANHHKNRRIGEVIWSFGVYNAYNRKNPNLVISIQGDDDPGPGSLKTISFLPVIPSVSYTRVF